MSTPTRATAAARIASAYAARDPREHHGKRLADAYAADPEAERLAALQTTDPTAYKALPPSVKVGVAYFVAAREAARALGRDITGGTS